MAVLAFVVVAPWYLTHLLGNLRYILSVRLLDPQHADTVPKIWQIFWTEGLMLPVIAALAGLALAALRRRWPDALAGLWLLLLTAMAFKPSAFGLRHDGALVVATVGLLPMALDALGALVPQGRRTVAMLALGLPSSHPPPSSACATPSCCARRARRSGGGLDRAQRGAGYQGLRDGPHRPAAADAGGRSGSGPPSPRPMRGARSCGWA